MFKWLQRQKPAAEKSTAGKLIASGPAALGIGVPRLERAQEQYRHNTGWAHVATRAISHRIAGQALHVAVVGRAGSPKAQNVPTWLKGLGADLEPLESHPLLDAVAEPNPIMIRWGLMVSTVQSLELTGRSFWWMPDGQERPEIWPLPSNWVKSVDPLRSSWEIRPTHTGQSFSVSAEQMAVFSLPDPSDLFSWLSPLQTQAPAVAADESLQMAQFRAFENGIFPRMAIRAGRLPGMQPGDKGERPVLTDDQRNELVESIKTIYGGAVNYDEPLILDGMIEGVERLSDKVREMDFVDSGKVTKSRILQAFGVSPLIVGEVEGANRAQAYVAEEVFCQNVVNPILEMMSQTFTRWVCPRFAGDQQLVAWVEPAKAHDDELTLKQWEIALKTGAATKNEFRRRVLNLPDMPGGDEPPSLFGARSHDRSSQNGRLHTPSTLSRP